ncbi:FAD:protein FMN transferase [Streptomyces gobiensis]|uniref:FAD:protein FMN transferase n=1 Tax=Streptomyces gobiensis TaxID=2875706 RepID=UPI001E35FC38|nr:FAD:protein FMN transferase [Streptomyces gobiensis]UGY95009.1 FAD:protein FMN transferase [Streptomyces gobiensis]
MGTVFSFDVQGTEPLVARAAVREAVHWLHRVDRLFSTYRPQSQLSRLARGEVASTECDPLIPEVLRLCADAEARSGGWFSARYAGRLDPTGLVKGWAVERAAQLLATAGATGVCVNGGGDIQLRGHPQGRPWRAGISDPLCPGRLVTVVEAAGQLAVATSGSAERGCHVVDPHTGAPAKGELASVTVLAPGLATADAWATAAFAMGSAARDWLTELPEVEAFAVSPDGDTWWTAGFEEFSAPYPTPGNPRRQR